MKQSVLPWAPAVAVLTLALFGAAQAPPAQALSCAVMSVERSVEHSDVVLVGTIVGFEESTTGPLSEDHGAGYGTKADVEVERYLKGSGPELVSLRSAMIGWSGGWSEEHIGQRWVFFLQAEDEGLFEPLCSGSQQVDGAYGISVSDVEEFTGPGVPPETAGTESNGAASPTEASSIAGTLGTYWTWGAGASALLAGAGAVGLAFVRRR